MKKHRWTLTFVVILVLFVLSCSLPFQYVGFDNPPREEYPPEDWHPEENHPEEMHFEEHPPEEFHPEEMRPEEMPGEEHPPQEFEEPQPQPQPQPQQPASGPFTADIAVTDIYPGKQPYGQFHVQITNHGPGTLNKVKVDVLCGYYTQNKKNGTQGPSDQANLNLSLGMKPGETQSFPTNLSLDLNTFEYVVGCDAHPDFDDPNPGNNSYTEPFK